MRATMIYGPGDIRVEDRDYPAIKMPGDAVVKVAAACVCGSDLWPYRGVKALSEPSAIGHEFVGVVESVGADVTGLGVGDFVIAPFVDSCGQCPPCQNGVTVACEHIAGWGDTDEHGFFVEGAQGQAVRVPQAEATLVKVPGVTEPDDALTASLLTLSDVMATGHHAAVSANVGPGRSVVVVGDGAVGLCGVLAAKRLGATRIIAMSRHEDRAALAVQLGATDVVAERGDLGVAQVRELLGGVLADSVLECVGTKESMEQALHSTRPGGSLGFVGVPTGGAEIPLRYLFDSNIHVAGGMASARTYIPELLKDVLAGTINPGLVFDSVMALEQAPEAYRAMDERRAIKVLLRP
ncbi:threonine dehydrogenase-like Zn-dependent dehydrogenase [Arthrobacter silviterrae]|uniref:Zinc-dependent alcohol dehydrogenase family protein n=1 Tax=Arthrobacter silviterrae TaxID=2026658 RepID=A0ABX0DAT8_9MICC|nr:zinc-dependent alcohol dehydrogenase family protein [Arthrobacter silviterrae]MDQ0278926.1 threonine dehydrogenase-like Zn-dependent dehydrogenase [Arthrobacter silviterrae]NGN84029.1 zinc-dependent alcohol dehydrogenase family protein [Arthrobacter silviterrae]